jgi:hypothetical protein
VCLNIGRAPKLTCWPEQCQNINGAHFTMNRARESWPSLTLVSSLVFKGEPACLRPVERLGFGYTMATAMARWFQSIIVECTTNGGYDETDPADSVLLLVLQTITFTQ